VTTALLAVPRSTALCVGLYFFGVSFVYIISRTAPHVLGRAAGLRNTQLGKAVKLPTDVKHETGAGRGRGVRLGGIAIRRRRANRTLAEAAFTAGLGTIRYALAKAEAVPMGGGRPFGRLREANTTSWFSIRRQLDAAVLRCAARPRHRREPRSQTARAIFPRSILERASRANGTSIV